MSRKFLVPLVLPADPTNGLEAATKQYVDAKAGANVVFQTGPPSDTNLLWADTDEAAGAAAYYGDVRAPWNERDVPWTGSTNHFGGVPGRSLSWGGSMGLNNQWIWVLPFPVQPGDAVTINKFRTAVETPQAGAKMCAAVYSAPSWAEGITMTKVTGCEAIDIDCSTAGNKTYTLAAPVTLPSGRYYLAWLGYGWASSSPSWYGQYSNRGFFGTDFHSGNNSTYDTFAVGTGVTALAATQSTSSVANSSNIVPIGMSLG